MTQSRHRILALSYYDGATSGFLDEVNNDSVFFFKVVAWDHEQDRRLYLVANTDRALYLELLSLLGKPKWAPDNPNLVPKWDFEHQEMEARANEIVERAIRELQNPVFLLLGNDVTDADRIKEPSPEMVGSAIALLAKPTPGSLSEWLPEIT